MTFEQGQALVRNEFAKLGGEPAQLRVVDITKADNPERLPPGAREWELTLRTKRKVVRATIPGNLLGSTVLAMKLRALLEASKS